MYYQSYVICLSYSSVLALKRFEGPAGGSWTFRGILPQAPVFSLRSWRCRGSYIAIARARAFVWTNFGVSSPGANPLIKLPSFDQTPRLASLEPLLMPSSWINLVFKFITSP
jgi:hypothetical protein